MAKWNGPVVLGAMAVGLMSGVAQGKDNDRTHREQAFYECMTSVCLPAASQCENNCPVGGSGRPACIETCTEMGDLCAKSCLVWNGLP